MNNRCREVGEYDSSNHSMVSLYCPFTTTLLPICLRVQHGISSTSRIFKVNCIEAKEKDSLCPPSGEDFITG
jgi:hypothetical protein